MAIARHSDHVIEEFIFDCMLENEIKYMPTVEMLKATDKDKYAFISSNGGTKFWRDLLKLQSREEYGYMKRKMRRMRRKG